MEPPFERRIDELRSYVIKGDGCWRCKELMKLLDALVKADVKTKDEAHRCAIVLSPSNQTLLRPERF